MKKSFASIILFILIAVLYKPYSSIGTRPDTIAKARFESSKHYNKLKEKFENRKKGIIIEMKKIKLEWETMKDWFNGWDGRVPNKKIVDVKPDLTEFLIPSDDLKIIWFGHSTFLLNMDGKVILVDPVFSASASPFSFLIKRFQKPVLELHELPSIDYILISHDHYDHLDSSTVKYFVDKKVKFVTPLGVGSHLIGWGIDKDRIVERDWWQTINFESISFTATPAQHFSGRDGFHDNETLWASWAIKSDNHNVYFSGDSGYDNHFKEIGEKLGPFDIAFLENGQYNKRWPNVHMFPNEAVKAFKDLKAKTLFPVHWGMFQLALHDWNEPIEKIFKLTNDENIPLIAPMFGEIVNLGNYKKVEKWW